jgi:hypothetical protein
LLPSMSLNKVNSNRVPHRLMCAHAVPDPPFLLTTSNTDDPKRGMVELNIKALRFCGHFGSRGCESRKGSPIVQFRWMRRVGWRALLPIMRVDLRTALNGDLGLKARLSRRPGYKRVVRLVRKVHLEKATSEGYLDQSTGSFRYRGEWDQSFCRIRPLDRCD